MSILKYFTPSWWNTWQTRIVDETTKWGNGCIWCENSKYYAEVRKPILGMKWVRLSFIVGLWDGHLPRYASTEASVARKAEDIKKVIDFFLSNQTTTKETKTIKYPQLE